MAAKKNGLGKGLGRGLDALIPEETAEKKTAAPAKAGEENEQGTMVKITKVEPNSPVKISMKMRWKNWQSLSNSTV